MKPKYQLAQIAKKEEKYDVALKWLKQIIEDHPSDALVAKEISECEKLEKEKMEKMKDEVVGQLKNLGNMFLGKFGLSTDNFKMTQNPDGSYGM